MPPFTASMSPANVRMNFSGAVLSGSIYSIVAQRMARGKCYPPQWDSLGARRDGEFTRVDVHVGEGVCCFFELR